MNKIKYAFFLHIHCEIVNFHFLYSVKCTMGTESAGHMPRGCMWKGEERPPVTGLLYLAAPPRFSRASHPCSHS